MQKPSFDHKSKYRLASLMELLDPEDERILKYLKDILQQCPFNEQYKAAFTRATFNASMAQRYNKFKENNPTGNIVTATSVPIVNASELSYDEFMTEYAMRKQPVIIKGGVSLVLPQNKMWSLESLQTNDAIANKLITTKRYVKDSIHWARLEEGPTMTLSKYIEGLSTITKELYLHDHSIPLHLPELSTDLSIPCYFATDYLQHLPEGSLYRETWPSLFIGPQGTSSQLHIDAFGSNFWMALFQGQKQWILINPDDMYLLHPRWYPNMNDIIFNTQLPSNSIDFQSCRRQECILNAGDLLFVPAKTPHYVQNLTHTLAISSNYIDSSNYHDAINAINYQVSHDNPQSSTLLHHLKQLTPSNSSSSLQSIPFSSFKHPPTLSPPAKRVKLACDDFLQDWEEDTLIQSGSNCRILFLQSNNTRTYPPVVHKTPVRIINSLSGAQAVGCRHGQLKRKKMAAMATGLDAKAIAKEIGPDVTLTKGRVSQCRVMMGMITGSYINVLLLVMPFAVWSYYAKWGDIPVFVLNFLAMMPLANLLGEATETLAEHCGDMIGGLVNATFGNAVEVIIAIFALKEGEIALVQSSLIGSMLSNLLLVLGCCFIAGHLGGAKESNYCGSSASTNMSLLFVTSFAMLVPSYYQYANFSDSLESREKAVLNLSHISALFLIAMYLQLMFFQLYTHRPSHEKKKNDDSSEENEDDDEPELSMWGSIILLGVSTLFVAILSEYLVSSVNGFTEKAGVNKSFVGIILLPIVGNAVEHLTAVKVALKNNMELAMGVAVGSATQISLFVVPVAVVAGWIMDKNMTLAFPTFEALSYVISVVVVYAIVVDGKSNWLEGSMLLTMYCLEELRRSPPPDLDERYERQNSNKERTPLITPAPSAHSMWFELAHNLYEWSTSSYVNALLVFAPFGIWAHYADWGKTWVFVLNFLAMIPLARTIGDATEAVAFHAGDVIGGLVNATFGNAVEVIIAIFALRDGQIAVVQSSLLGSILSNLLLVLGCCFVAGGTAVKESKFNDTSASANSSLLMVSCFAMLVPSYYQFTNYTDTTYSTEQTVQHLSHISAIFLLLMYIQLLYFQLSTHAHLFNAAEAMEDDDEEDEPMSLRMGILVLFVATIGVSILSEYLVSSIDGFVSSTRISKSFVGIIILPIVGNAVEHITAVRVALKDRMELAMGVAVGSATQISLFVVPVTVVAGWILNQPMTLAFPTFEAVTYVTSIVVVYAIVADGRSNWLEGSMLLTIILLIYHFLTKYYPPITTQNIPIKTLLDMTVSVKDPIVHLQEVVVTMGQEGDVRRNYVLQLIESMWRDREVSVNNLQGEQALNEFLDNPACSTLQARLQEKSVVLATSAQWENNNNADTARAVLLMKVLPQPLTADNLSTIVQVVSMTNSPVFSLFHSVHKIYTPLLMNTSLSQKLKDVLLELDTGLQSLVRDKGDESLPGNDLNLFGIVTIQDEIQYWEKNNTGRERERSSKFSAYLDTIHSRYSSLSTLSFDEMGELLDDTNNTLDDIWRADLEGSAQYPQQRMAHFFGLVVQALNSFIVTKAGTLNVWRGAFHAVQVALSQSIALCEKWLGCMEQLTTTDWPSYDEHPWRGPPHSDNFLPPLVKRLEEILRIRTTYQELVSLSSDGNGLNTHCFDVFDKVYPLHYNPYTNSQWTAAVAEFETVLAPIETQVGGNLQESMASVLSKPTTALRYLQQYQNLLKRPTISRLLAGERDNLLAQLVAQIDQIESDFENRASDEAPCGKNLSSKVNYIVWGKMLTNRITNSVALASNVLSDLPGFQGFKKAADSVLQKVTGMITEHVRLWREDVESNLKSSESKLTGRLMEIDKAGYLTVNYSEFLVTLLRDVRQLMELSDQWVPPRILEVANEAEKYYRYGVTLKKVANFYNNMESQVIEEQKPMLLDALIAFEEIVKKPGKSTTSKTSKPKAIDVTWNNLEECEEYVKHLQQAADALSIENRKLRRAHEKIGEDLVLLMDVDLLRYPEKWKDKNDTIKAFINVTIKKYDPNLTKRWLLYWDHQLYKVLEAGYQIGLESLNENLPEIKVEVIFPQRGPLQFKPPIEELRANYYKSMKKFIGRPAVFKGFGNGAIFATMTDMNAANIVHVYRSGETLFTKLKSLLAEYESWTFLTRVAELDTLLGNMLSEVVDWETNFKTLKLKRKESDKIPDFIKVDCVGVSLVPFKSGLDENITRLQDALLISLRKSISGHLKVVEDYLDSSMDKLNKRPHSIEEIGAAKLEWKEIDGERTNIQAIVTKAEKKKTLLLNATAGSSIDTSDVVNRLAQIPSKWENFEIALEAFNEMIEEQRESLKGELETKTTECNAEIEKFAQRWSALKPVEISNWDATEVSKIYVAMAEWKEQLNELIGRSKVLIDNCTTFQMTVPTFDGVAALEADINKVESNWNLYKDFNNELEVLAKQDWITFRPKMFDLADLGTKWSDLLKTVEHSSIVERILDYCGHIKRAMPTLKLCRGDPFKEEHWTQLLRKIGVPKGITLVQLTVGHFLDCMEVLEAQPTLQFVKVLHARAQGEVTIRDALQELKAWTQTAELSLLEHEQDGKKISIIKDWKEITLQLGDNQSLLASLKESQFFKPFADQASQYETKMALLDQSLTQLNIIQRKWVYLEPIFSKGALPSEQARFKRIDEDFREIMQTIESDPKLFNLADDMMFPKLLERLATMVDQLERCQKALADFLEEKRSRFPRFYFIGDEDLLEILGQSQNPSVIQSHLKKLYQGIHRVEFSEKKDQIIAMCSSAQEKVLLNSPITITSAVEEWLEALTEEMRKTLKQLVAKAASAASPDYTEFPSQVLCLAEQLKFNTQCEAAIKNDTISELKSSLQDTLRELTSLDLSNEPLMHLKVKALVLDLVHHIDVCDQLVGVTSLNDWRWQKQLRFYLDKNKSCIIKMHDAVFDYTYEYQGNAPKLVHTPLTDKCYLTLTQGMHMGFGGNPYGPAGTGKTESVKALGGQFGRQVLVFNCDEGIDFQSMGRIFIGLVKCGAWGCFDEFNRLKEDQLSAISQQIQLIQDAIKNHVASINLLNRHVEVDINAGIFVTLNPAGKGYGGRSKLPDNLKALFRPVAMGRPDNNLIAEVVLASEGFSESKDIASKVVSLYTLSRQLLTPQQHYDWGLRALKAVLSTGGKLLQQAKKAEGKRLTPAQETEILIKAVRINTLSKLTFGDSQRFLALIGDVFPGIASADISGGDLEAAIREVMEKKPFCCQVDDLQIRKMLQLKESLDQRMGCVVVGPSGSGKSTVWQVLQQAMIRCGQLVKTHIMNPKSMPRERLLGHMDLDTREWHDGVLTDAARKVVKEPENVRSWIVCDGDVDPEWIESLNSVLDDNHLLTLPNGERINFGPNVNFVFETHDLRFASPATISRMGMIFLSDEDMDIKRLLSKWLALQPEAANLSKWIDELFFLALEEVAKYDKVVATTTVGSIMNGLSHVASAKTRSEFVVALIRGLGANLTLSHRATFAKSVFLFSNERPPDIGSPLDCYCVGSSYASYETKRSTYDDGSNTISRTSVIQTISMQRGLQVIAPWVEKMEPFILVGPEGCGKNMLVRQAFQSLKGVSFSVLHCNAQTTADHVIAKIAQCCSLFSTNSGRVYRPRDGDRLVLYLKDINLPKPDQYDTCMLIAFLQQLLTFQGFFDPHLEFLGVERVQIVASMNAATTVGRHMLSTRFTAIVRVAAMDYPTAEELTAVYSTFLEGVLAESPTMKDTATRDKLAHSMVELYESVRSKFSVDEHRHYLFTPRDLTQWAFGLLRYDLANEEVLDVLGYEARRLFRDRLVDAESKSKFDSALNTILKQQWRHQAKLQDVYFTSLGMKRTEDMMLIPLRRMTGEDFQSAVAQGIVLYEREEKELHMLLFEEILDHLAVVDRSLSELGGALLLIGYSGVGRRTATTLIAHMLGYKFFTPTLTRNYNASTFRSDLKTIVQCAGVDGEHAVLYLEDHHFSEDAILELTNSLLSAGEVPGLYTHEELEPLLSPLKEKMMESTVVYRTVYDFFVARVQSNLHVVLSMDARNEQFVRRCESNPALYTRCSITWMGDWATSSLKKIPEMLLTNSELLQDQVQRVGLLNMVNLIYESVQGLGATPREYISFLQTWHDLFNEKSKQLLVDVKHLKSGLSKLEEASATVDDLSKSAVVKKRELGAAQVSADEAMDEIKRALDRASVNRREVEDLKKQLAKAEESTNARKREIEDELSEITPVLQSAKEAVGAIKSDNINEIRSLKMPPEPIHDVLSAVLMLLGIQDTSWNSMKKFLGNRGVKDDIQNYDSRRITPEISKAVTKLLKAKSASFEHENIYRVSVAAAPLATWVKANMKYSVVLAKIEPLEADLAEAKRSLEASQQRLQSCEGELKAIDVKVDEMKSLFGEKTKEAEILRVGLERAEATLQKAQGLLGKLGGEQTRWSAQVKDLEHRVVELPLKLLMASGFTTFLGQCSEDKRASIAKGWDESIDSPTIFDYRKLMSSESEMLTWKSLGLPADNLSMENGLIVHYTRDRCPFIIDPANAATGWLQAHLAKDATRPLSVVQSQEARFVSLVEQAVRFGKTLAILEVDTVEPYLYPLIRKDLNHEGPRYIVRLGDKDVDYNDNFRMVLVTRNPDPELPPDARAIVNVVNFTVTKSGLEGQLLGVTIQNEQPELESQKSELLKNEEEFKVQLATLEKQLLEALATSEGDILDNTTLIESLTRTKATSADIEDALKKSATKSEELDEQRAIYAPFARDGARLFFLVKSLHSVNHMYRFSLASFITLFKATLASKMDVSSIKERISRLSPVLETKVLMFVGRSLFKEHRPMFGLHLIHGMHEDAFEVNEWEYFVGDIMSDGKKEAPLPDWAASDRRDAFTLFVETFPRLASQVKFDASDVWLRWSKALDCEVAFHAKVDKALTPFQKVLIIQALRPDRLQTAIQNFICTILKVKTLTPPPLDFKDLATNEASSVCPVLLITTAGADPSKELEEVATEMVGREHYFEVAMGGGQQEKALNLLKSTAENGEWLCLQNLHLVIAWLVVLEKELNTLNPNRKFRLWCTTESHDAFPLILLEQSLKVTYESPPGLKKNLLRTYATFQLESNTNSVNRMQLLFLLGFFHSLLQERRTYIPQGWTKFYEFSFGDLRAGFNIMEAASQQSSVDWSSIHGLMENAIYGGRIDNPYDLRVLRCYLQMYFTTDTLQGKSSLCKGVKMPNTEQREDFVALIEHLQETDPPRLFGLPDNIERSVQRTASSAVIAQLRTLTSSAQASSKFDREKWRVVLGPLIENWTKLTSSLNLEQTTKENLNKEKSGVAVTPVEAFVTMENAAATDLAKHVNNGLMNIKKVIYGTGLLTPAIQNIASALLVGVVPADWSNRWEASEVVQVWLRSLALRKRALNEWKEDCAKNILLSRPLDLSEVLQPGTFLNALRQQAARSLKCSMDGMKLISCWEKDKTTGSIEWYSIGGLLLQGASFEGGVLQEPSSDGQELVAVPTCYIAYVRDEEREPYAKDACIKVPLYYSISRERMLVEISLPIAGDSSKWIIGGVALFLGE
ncbi:dynein heavy chain [Thraustotheca clavata]|uniref:Cytoplasmic dynein 2 heavy chain 1 n=1 Tax=Thraustotheca clavata TaxID=74557 RepID=A0A1W0A6P2_9STRA|nr:dynein heavy chain [Thraustotheca clavata]